MPVEQLRLCVDSSHAIIATPQGQGDREGVQRAIGDLIAYVRAADHAGADSFWLTEDPDGWEASQLLAIAAWETDRIRVGPGVFNPWYRHPAHIAASISTLDAVSDGRAFLGFGRGQTEWYERGLGMTVEHPVTALEEAIGLLRQWFARPWVARGEAGAKIFRVAKWPRVTGPVQEHLPIYLAAVGPQALSVGARLADGIIFNELASETFMERTIGEVRAAAEAAGRDPAALRFFARSAVAITDDPEAVYERRKATVAMIHALPGMERLLETPGFDTEAMIAEVRREMRTMEVLARGGNFPELRAAGDLAAAKAAIPTALMHDLVVAGPVDAARAQLRTLREIGVTDVFLARPPGDPEAIGDVIAALLDA
ncbi:MAG TPA: LLM class flavin-dependent oxidoreductase [Mycobacteriales bacterium]|nr:LLM class flavin-dependent oxidoreductase [Mycobacteriales bacterium]